VIKINLLENRLDDSCPPLKTWPTLLDYAIVAIMGDLFGFIIITLWRRYGGG